MYTPSKLIAKNFLSFKELEYDFQQKKAVLIQGINLTDKGSKSNGSGKSSLQEMIYYAYIGDTSRSISTKKLIRREENKAEVTLILVNRQNQILRIVRTLSQKGSATLTIDICAAGNTMWQPVQFATVNDGNKILREMIGITADDFKNFFLVNRKNYSSFFNLSDTAKKEFIGRFSNADRIKKIYPVIDMELNNLAAKNDRIKYHEIVEIQTKMKVLEESIEQLKLQKEHFSPDVHIGNAITEIEHCERKQEEIADEIDRLEQVSFNFKTKQINRNINIFEGQLNRLKKISFDNEVKEFEKLLEGAANDSRAMSKMIESQEKEKSIINKAIMEINNLLETAIECPECQNVFSLQDEGFDEEKIMGERHELQCALDELEVEMGVNIGELKYLKDRYDKISAAKHNIAKKENRRARLISKSVENLTKSQEDLNWLNKQKAEHQTKIDVLMVDIELLDKEIEHQKKVIESLENDNQTKSIEALIKKNQKELKQLQGCLIEKEDEWILIEEKWTEKKKWLLNFKKFYSYLSNHSLKVIEDRTNHFLDMMDTNLSVQIEGFKELASGEIREQITVHVLRDGELEGVANEFSTGEQGRLECAMVLTNQAIINETAGIGKGLDFIAIDEILDGVDGEGMLGITKSLQNVNRTVFLISHITIEEVIDNDVLTVVKENRISRVA
jgi:DNA repair exonuclease SbcCD ATPase subunit